MTSATPPPSSETEKAGILVLTSTFPRWIGDKEPPFVYELCKRLQSQFDCYVLAPHSKGAQSDEQIQGLQIRRFRYFFERWQSLTYEGGILARLKQNPFRYLLVPLFLLAEIRSTVSQLKKYPIDAIHAHWLIPQGLAAIIARKILGKHTPILCTLHGGDLYSLNGRLLKAIKKFVLRRVDGITVVSRAMQKDVEAYGVPPSCIQVIPMGVDLQNTFKPRADIPRNKDSLLFAGRLVEKKGAEYLLKAMPQVLTRIPGVQLQLAGDGPEKNKLEALAKSLGLQNNIRFLGKIENSLLPALYNRNQLFVFPSIIAKSGDREGFGLVIVEALGCECCVISTDLEAMRDIIQDDSQGIIVPQKDADALANAIVDLLENPGKREYISKHARQHVLKQFDWDIIGKKYSAFLLSLIQQNN